MRALVFQDSLKLLTDYPLPPRGAGEALVRVRMAGVCNTDIEITKGYMGFQGIIGHEFIGVVQETDDSTLIGKRVVGEINCSCGQMDCQYCGRGLLNHCPRRSVLGILNRDGAFAEFLTLPESNLHIVPDSIANGEAVFVEPLAAAFQILEQVSIGPRDRVVCLGAGKLGLLAAQVVAMTQCDLLAVGKHRSSLAILENRSIRTSLLDELSESDFDIVIDCTGSPSGFEHAVKLVRPRGTIILKSTVAESTRSDGQPACRPLNLAPLVINEITLIGSRCGPFPKAIDALANKEVDVRSLISNTFTLDEGLRAMKEAAKRGVLKILLDVY